MFSTTDLRLIHQPNNIRKREGGGINHRLVTENNHQKQIRISEKVKNKTKQKTHKHEPKKKNADVN